MIIILFEYKNKLEHKSSQFRNQIIKKKIWILFMDCHLYIFQQCLKCMFCANINLELFN